MEEGRIDEISVYSVDRISRSIEDLCEIVSFLHEPLGLAFSSRTWA